MSPSPGGLRGLGGLSASYLVSSMLSPLGSSPAPVCLGLTVSCLGVN